MLLDLMEERQKWVGRRDESIREISRLSELIRATANMIPPEQLARYEPIFERIEQRPAGLSMAIRTCFTGVFSPEGAAPAGASETGTPEKKPGAEDRGWLTPVEIRDALKRMGFPFENYKANPLASIHTTLKRMVPGEIEVKTRKDGQKLYRLKSAGEWARAFAEAREWVKSNFEWHRAVVSGGGGSLIGVRPRSKKESDQKRDPEDKKHGPPGSA